MELMKNIWYINDTLEAVEHKTYYFTREMLTHKVYKSHIVCCEFANNQDLEKFWEEVVNCIALNIQANVEQIIEAYNIYIIFFCKDITDDLEFLIEQDRYSARKVIIKDSMPCNLERLEIIVENRLFNISISKNDEDISDIKRFLYGRGKLTYNLVEKIKGRIQNVADKDIENVLNSLNMEEHYE